MSRKTLILVLTGLSVAASSAVAQRFGGGIGAGSTVQGDYLRGVGIAAAGMGVYNVDTAVANSINTNTAIRWNEYVSAVAEYQARKYAKIRERQRYQNKKNYEANLDRIKNDPNHVDLMRGDALNDLRRRLLDTGVSEGLFKLDPVTLEADVIRRIPFKLGAEGIMFSMNRLTAKGKDKWPVALRDPQFDSLRKTYERTLDAVMEQQIEGKRTIAAVNDVVAAIDALSNKLEQTNLPRGGTLYKEAKARLLEFKKMTTNLLQSQKIDKIIGQLDQYAGTTVHDLLKFMEKYNLEFATAETPEERELFPKLYASLEQQRKSVKGE